MNEPHGKLSIIKTEIIKQNVAAIFWKTTFRDENGKIFMSTRSIFRFELKEVQDGKEISKYVAAKTYLSNSDKYGISDISKKSQERSTQTLYGEAQDE